MYNLQDSERWVVKEDLRESSREFLRSVKLNHVMLPDEEEWENWNGMEYSKELVSVVGKYNVMYL